MKVSRSTRRILLESALIVFSILLALGLEAWWQERREAARVDDARRAFVEEIRSNLARLESESYYPRHQAMWEAFREASRIEAPTDADLQAVYERFDGGIWPTPFRDAVWRSLSNTDLMGRLPFDDLFLIADIYREQHSIDGWHQRMFTLWSEARSDRDEPSFIRDDIQRTRTYLADVVAGEGRLIEQYRTALQELTDED